MTDLSVDAVPVPSSPNGFHPVDAANARDPHPALRELRATCPVSRVERDGLPPVVVLTRLADIAEVYREYRTFESIGFFPSLDAYNALNPALRSIIELNPPDHTRVRRLSLLALKPGAVDAALPYVEQVAKQLLRAVRRRGEAELVHDFAVPLPADAIAAVLGLPESDAEMIHDWVDSTFSEPAGDAPPPSAHACLARSEHFDAYLQEQIDWRRRQPEPPDDAITRMLQFEGGGTFSDEQLVVHIRTLLMAGNETSTSLISNAVYRLLSLPDAYARLHADRSLVAPFIEECLRFDTPLTQQPRRCVAPADIAGFRVEPDDVISPHLPSANRDERVFGDDADEFVIDRFVDRSVDHIAFGVGVHHCVGAHLARRTAQIALGAVLDELPDLELAPGCEYDKVWFFQFWRPRRLDVRFTP